MKTTRCGQASHVILPAIILPSNIVLLVVTAAVSSATREDPIQIQDPWVKLCLLGNFPVRRRDKLLHGMRQGRLMSIQVKGAYSSDAKAFSQPPKASTPARLGR
ncbi:hypothetical protein FPOAC2_01849 [Fusarium poae]